MKKTIRHNRGFTLVEIMVSLLVFSIVATIAGGAFLRMTDANRKAQSLKSAINNLHFALEEMSREIRMGTAWHCGSQGTHKFPRDCTSGDNYFVFENADSTDPSPADQYVYTLNGTQLVKSINDGNTWVPLTAPEVIIDNLTFVARNTDVNNGSPDNNPALLFIYVKGHVTPKGKSAQRTDFSLQTTLSQRLREN